MNRTDAERIAGKWRAIEAKHTRRYTMLTITAEGELPAGGFEAPTLAEACRVHVHAWHRRPSSQSVVLVAPCGKRYSYDDSVAEVAK